MSRPPRVPFDSLLASLRPGGRDFERVCKWMLENAPEYRQEQLNQVWLRNDWPGRCGRDGESTSLLRITRVGCGRCRRSIPPCFGVLTRAM